MKLQNTKWLSELVCFMVDNGFSVRVLSSEYSLSTEVSTTAYSLFRAHRPDTESFNWDSAQAGNYSGCTFYKTDRAISTVPFATISFMPDGEIVDFVFGSHPIVFGRSPSDRYTRELNLIESGEPSDVFAALNMLASTRR